jgi:hypothetical protein
MKQRPVPDALTEARDRIANVVSEAFRELEPVLRERAAAEQETRATRLNEQFRRMRAFESDRDWWDALLDAAVLFCGRAAFFSQRKDQLSFQGARGTAAGTGPSIAAPVNSRDTVVYAGAERAYVIPIALANRIPGVLYAEQTSNLAALEMIANFAGAALEYHLLVEEGVATRPPRVSTPEHAAARRFARVAVARIVLHEFEAVRRGRAEHSLYSGCASSIDSAREQYRKRFPTLPDYLHEEIVRVLANNQPELLGANYPKPLP